MDSFEKVKEYLKKYQMEDRILVAKESSATVAEAALTFNTEEARIAKTLSFDVDGKTIVVVCSGDTKVDNAKYKAEFNVKAKMLTFDEVLPRVGHPVGGVCPFALNDDVEIYLDESLKRFPTVFPACGSTHSAIELTIEELEKTTNFLKWVDVCKVKEV